MSDISDPSPAVLIWDVGGVILDWNPAKFLDAFEKGKYKKECLAIFQHTNWFKFDRGDFSYQDIVAIYSEQLNLPAEKIVSLLEFALRSLHPKWPTINFIKQLKNLGFEQFCLTNGSKEYLTYVTSDQYKKIHDFCLHDLFHANQIVLSAAINLAKPEPAIYQHTVDVFELHDRNIIFIDDVEANIKAAEAMGWTGVHFKDLDECVKKLNDLGVEVE